MLSVVRLGFRVWEFRHSLGSSVEGLGIRVEP